MATGSSLSQNYSRSQMIKQRFNPQVYDDFVVRGNTAVLRCHLPTFVKEYVSVDSWIRNDDYVLKMTDTRTLERQVGPMPRHLERTDAAVHFRLTIGQDVLGVYLPWLGLAADEACPLAIMTGWMVTTCFNALDSMNPRLTTSSVGTGRLAIKCSRRQSRVFNK
ncbi:uncharacterized protein TNCV_3907061 [Trichonephila clavipes]|nr:uncharacterized protein TNCV_3907061 [Trichonephila clavipes]